MNSKLPFQLILTVILLLLSACSNSASMNTVTISPTTPVPQSTSTATVTPTLSPTPSPSPTSTARPTSTVTSVPTATPTSTIPIFKNYVHPSGAFSFDVPVDWVLRQEGETNVIVSDSKKEVGVGVVFFKVPGLDSREKLQNEIESLIQAVADQVDTEYEIIGQKDLPNNRILVNVKLGILGANALLDYIFESHNDIIFMQYIDVTDSQKVAPIQQAIIDSFHTDVEAATIAISDIAIKGTLVTFYGDNLNITYPGTWLETLDRCEEVRQPGDDFECLFSVTLPESDNTHIFLLRMDMPGVSSIDQLDKEVWEEAIETPSSGVVTKSREIIEVDEKQAIKRIFTRPSPQVADGRANILMIYFLYNKSLYQFNGWTNGPDNFEKYQAEMEKIMTSIKFTHPAKSRPPQKEGMP